MAAASAICSPSHPRKDPGCLGYLFPLTALPPYSPPRKAARCIWKRLAFRYVHNLTGVVAEDVQFLVVSRCGCAVAGLVLFLIGHSLSWRIQRTGALI